MGLRRLPSHAPHWVILRPGPLTPVVLRVAGPRGTAGTLGTAHTGGGAEEVSRAGRIRVSPSARRALPTGRPSVGVPCEDRGPHPGAALGAEASRATWTRGGWCGPAAHGPWSAHRWACLGGVDRPARRTVRATGHPSPAVPRRMDGRRELTAPRPGSGVIDSAVARGGRRSPRVPGQRAVASSGAAFVHTLHEAWSVPSATPRDAAP